MRIRALWLALWLGFLSLMISGGTAAQSGVRAVVVNEFANVRIVPAIGADVVATVPSGYVFEFINGRSPDGEWLRVDFNGGEGWVNITPLTILSGDVGALPVADPRSIPFGGFDAPRAGLSAATSPVIGRLPDTGVRVRAGPSTGYPVLADPLRYSEMFVTGRTASNTWIQVNFEGTLGWATAGYFELRGGSLIDLPINGIVADELPISGTVAEDYLATLRLFRDRIDLAQPSLDGIRTAWTDAALTGRAACRPYPARPSDYNIPNPLLAAYYDRLEPIGTLFNDAMANVRLAIDLYIDVCQRPGIQNPVGQAEVIGALETIALADQQFAELRARLAVLLPPDREPGPDECLFTFQGFGEILRLAQYNFLYFDEFTPRDFVTGFCLDAVQGQTILIETVQIPDSNIVPLISFSPVDNPTQFTAVIRGFSGVPGTSLGPVLIPATGRYLVIIADVSGGDRPAPPEGEFGVLFSIVPATYSLLTNQPILQLDPLTGNLIVVPPNLFVSPTANPFGPPVTSGPPLQGQAASVPNATDPAPIIDPAATSPIPADSLCPGLSLTCEQLASCDEAYACLDAGNFSLDPDGDGVPCEITRCPASN